jgi:hypothetical protein
MVNEILPNGLRAKGHSCDVKDGDPAPAGGTSMPDSLIFWFAAVWPVRGKPCRQMAVAQMTVLGTVSGPTSARSRASVQRRKQSFGADQQADCPRPFPAQTRQTAEIVSEPKLLCFAFRLRAAELTLTIGFYRADGIVGRSGYVPGSEIAPRRG